MNQYLLIKQGNIHNAVEKEAFTADILIENGKIKKIAPVLEGAVINDAEIIDASGIDVYPGFVDAHCHLGLDGCRRAESPIIFQSISIISIAARKTECRRFVRH